jgi:hypothetical protein
VLIQRASPTMRPCRKKNPQRPYTTLGTAAIRSTTVTSVRRSRRGAYSEMNSAVPVASGTATVIATSPTRTVPASTAAMPKLPASGSHRCVVRNPQPRARSASAARIARKKPTSAMTERTATALPRVTPRNARSARSTDCPTSCPPSVASFLRLDV